MAKSPTRLRFVPHNKKSVQKLLAHILSMQRCPLMYTPDNESMISNWRCGKTMYHPILLDDLYAMLPDADRLVAQAYLATTVTGRQ